MGHNARTLFKEELLARRHTKNLDNHFKPKGKKVKNRVLLGVALLIAVALGMGGLVHEAAAQATSNGTNADCVGANTSNLNTNWGLTPPKTVEVINTDGDPNYQLGNPGNLEQAFRDGKLVTYVPNSGYLQGCQLPPRGGS